MSISGQNSDTYTVKIYSTRLLFPLWFFKHLHIVTEHDGIINRYEVSGRMSKNHPQSIGGFVFKNLLPPTTGLFIVAAKNPLEGFGPRWPIKLESKISGGEGTAAHTLYSFIESEKILSYPYAHDYDVIKGPNSNTFVQWVINQVPQANLKLPMSAWGKNSK